VDRVCPDRTLGVRLIAESVRRQRLELRPTSGFSTDSARAHASTISWQRNALQKWTIRLIHLGFLALSKIKKCPGGTKICCHPWHPTLRDNVQVWLGQWRLRLTKCIAPKGEHFESERSR
jgi:hypothetical protein